MLLEMVLKNLIKINLKNIRCSPLIHKVNHFIEDRCHVGQFLRILNKHI